MLLSVDGINNGALHLQAQAGGPSVAARATRPVPERYRNLAGEEAHVDDTSANAAPRMENTSGHVWIIMAHRSGSSVLGAAEAPCKDKEDRVMTFPTREEAQAKADLYNADARHARTLNVWYTVEKLGG